MKPSCRNYRLSVLPEINVTCLFVYYHHQECLGFDNAIAALEKGISGRKGQLQDLESMCNDAQLARDMAKVHACQYKMLIGSAWLSCVAV